MSELNEMYEELANSYDKDVILSALRYVVNIYMVDDESWDSNKDTFKTITRLLAERQKQQEQDNSTEFVHEKLVLDYYSALLHKFGIEGDIDITKGCEFGDGDVSFGVKFTFFDDTLYSVLLQNMDEEQVIETLELTMFDSISAKMTTALADIKNPSTPSTTHSW